MNLLNVTLSGQGPRRILARLLKPAVLAALLLALLASSAFAGVVEKKASLGGFDGFVERMGAGTRELGRGNTGSADTASMPAAYWNPAILGFRGNLGYTLNGEKRDLDRAGGAVGIESPVGKRMGVGFAMLYRGDLDFKVVDDELLIHESLLGSSDTK